MENDFRPAKQMMKEDFNIEESQTYKILFVSDLLGDAKTIKGNILYFNTSQMCVKTEEGLYIIERVNIKEMLPIKFKIQDKPCGWKGVTTPMRSGLKSNKEEVPFLD